MPDLSVVIPAYNEAERLPRTLTEILGYLAPSSLSFEVLVVDDGSKDATAAEARRFHDIDRRVELLALPQNGGKGWAVRTGALTARGDTVLVVDADGATPFTELSKLQAALAAGADVAVGTRASKSHKQEVRALWHRKFLGTLFNALVAAIVVPGFSDTQCGFKLFRRAAARDLFGRGRLDGYCYDVEILAMARRRGLRVAEVAVDWAEKPGSKVNLFVDPLLMLRDLFSIRWWQVSGVYDRPLPGGDDADDPPSSPREGNLR